MSVLVFLAAFQASGGSLAPRVLEVDANRVDGPEIQALVSELREQADAFLFLSGGASRMAAPDQERLLSLFESFDALAASGLRFAVGDGGTKAGIMEAAGRARARSENAFPLLGISPAPEILPLGDSERTAIDSNHSHIVAVTHDAWSDTHSSYWGSETEAMYRIFADLADGRPSVALVANGGGITLSELEWNLRQGRRVVVIEGSGRAADAVAAAIRGTATEDEDVVGYLDRAREIVGGHEALLRLFDLSSGAEKLADALREELSR